VPRPVRGLASTACGTDAARQESIVQNTLLASSIAAGVFLAAALPAQAAVAYNEALSGDLSNSGAAPTSFAVASGSNQVLGTTGNPGTGVDRDYFSFTVPTGQLLVGITVLPGTTFLGGAALSFIGIQAGSAVTVSPTGGTAAGLLGWTHYRASDIGNDILTRMGTPAAGSSGFAAPLGAGTYSFWVQEISAGTASYGFDFQLAPVPEPGTTALFGAGLALLAWRGCRARRG
jgi:hypothetical protein